ncbi:TPA: helix-turn-helix transcriptional regulator [Streptococcus suis]|nr:helix-turn-helix transcriptional regulator [Streptococcus suis]
MTEKYPLRELAQPLLGKWAVAIILSLAEGEKHFALLEREIGQVSRKVLDQNLKALIEINLVEKIGQSSQGYKVFYRLTPLGKEFLPLLLQIKQWIRDHEEELKPKK